MILDINKSIYKIQNLDNMKNKKKKLKSNSYFLHLSVLLCLRAEKRYGRCNNNKRSQISVSFLSRH